MRILLGFIMMGAGFLITWKSEWLFRNFGTIPMFEKYFHASGGGRFGYKMVGIIVIFVGIFVITNIHAQILTAIAKLFTPGA